MKKLINKTTAVLILLLTHTMLFGQQRPELSIGDPIPALSYSHWVKGTPQDKLSGDKIYVLEFWATWCIPCIAAMPHISDLADQYKGKVKVIGVNILERIGDQAYSGITPKVKEFVQKNQDRMRFDVIVDDDQRTMHNKWLTKAGISGIPATFVVKNEQILWIGHPNFVSSVLKEILEGKYDIQSRKKEYEKQQIASAKGSSIFSKNMGRVDSAITAKRPEEAINLLDSILKVSPSGSYAYRQRKMQILVAFNQEASINYLKEMAEREPKVAAALACYIASQENVNHKINILAVDIIEKHGQKNTFTLDALALLQSKIGRYVDAVKNQQEVLGLLIEAQKKTPDLISKEAIDDSRKKVDKYRLLSEKMN
ncbi:thiol-disulfide isomerase/thioredoxin [Pedobacter africanus]|uniref:Thiol-disulfide isomerase/thioredoxin n=1 Tax=Pedobacter africanus TaxID=151894 RepID=A0ACC6KVL7_9SPHI|nr:TlpA disulfide reductase family protein [Pedobacter africanus]MDR6783384.1 thiol-disulfide isomerase/thioredoxin [Pedobacter africanus]